jgi:hypothetical protein
MHLFFLATLEGQTALFFPCSPSTTHRSKIKIKRLSGLGRGRRGKEGGKKKTSG